jgi:methylated-DNA-[protein]-cysteine S-methyltransferase
MVIEQLDRAQTSVDSPFGHLQLEADGHAITRLNWLMEKENLIESDETWQKLPDYDSSLGGNSDSRRLLDEAVHQLRAYFYGDLRNFELPLAPVGTDFQQRVWREMAKIPFGQTITYGELAARSGSVARAVGGACGANPIPIIIPCHRVLGGGGKLGGFSGGLGPDSKRALLEHEGALTPGLGL